MKKILIIVMLLLTSIAYAENQYTMVSESNNSNGGVWVLDNKTNKLTYCFWQNDGSMRCSWPARDLERHFEDRN